MTPELKLWGSIDLSLIDKSPRLPNFDKFRLLEAIVEDELGSYSLLLFDEGKELCGCGVSLIVGKNGVGKSYLFRALIDFFVDFYWSMQPESKRPYSNSRYKIQQLKYILGSHKYTIIREGNKFITKINENETSPNDVVIPNIVACHFGLYDRFPIRKDRYDVDFYKYVGTKASGNFISTNNIITQMLFSLCEDREDRVIRRIIRAFTKIGYDPKVSIRIKLRDSAFVTSFEKFRNLIEQQVERTSTFNTSILQTIKKYTLQQKKEFYNAYRHIRRNGQIVLDLNDFETFKENRLLFSKIYLLKQLQLTTKLNITFYKESRVRDCNSLSSGEINMLATVVSIASCIDESPVLILLDEPELNQHPNWQMSIINELYKIFGDFPCHLFIASHSHFLVSDLPGESSVVIQMDYCKQGLIGKILPENTYGWSAEQVLLEVFETGTDRNLYLGHLLGTLLDQIKNRELDSSKVQDKLDFLIRVSENLKEFDPLKKIISSLARAFNYQK